MKDLFSTQASVYARFRPTYPKELYEFLYANTHTFSYAWDCGTGNGQVARELATAFTQVIATDISDAQLSHAAQAKNILYKQCAETNTGIPDHTVDLITVGTALHWFNFEAFYKEVERVAKPGALLAVWCYSLMKVNSEIDPILNTFCFDTLKNYWDKERRWVDEAYQTIPFPFQEITHPSFTIHTNWTLEHVEGYLNSWSAVQHYIRIHQHNPVDDIMPLITPLWKNEMPVSFPLPMRAGRIKG